MEGIEAKITAVLKEYTDEVAENIIKAAEDCAKGLKKDISAGSPKRTGAYAKGWKVKKIPTGSNRAVSFVVHNATDYQKTHVLEKGHAGPKKSSPRTPPYPHIAGPEKRWKEEFLRRCEEACKR